MQVKVLEIRDEGTFFPMLCINLGMADNEDQRHLLHGVGFPLDGRPNIAVTHATCSGHLTNDPYEWGPDRRTYSVSHNYIINHWDELKDGDVIDVQFILGETKVKKIPQRQEAGY